MDDMEQELRVRELLMYESLKMAGLSMDIAQERRGKALEQELHIKISKEGGTNA